MPGPFSSTPFSGFRLSPTLETNIAGCPLITHLLVQMPHPIQSSKLARGCFTVTFSPVSVVACASSNQIAFLGVGQCSSQTMHVDRKSTRLNSSHLGISYAV